MGPHHPTQRPPRPTKKKAPIPEKVGRNNILILKRLIYYFISWICIKLSGYSSFRCFFGVILLPDISIHFVPDISIYFVSDIYFVPDISPEVVVILLLKVAIILLPDIFIHFVPDIYFVPDISPEVVVILLLEVAVVILLLEVAIILLPEVVIILLLEVAIILLPDISINFVPDIFILFLPEVAIILLYFLLSFPIILSCNEDLFPFGLKFLKLFLKMGLYNWSCFELSCRSYLVIPAKYF